MRRLFLALFLVTSITQKTTSDSVFRFNVVTRPTVLFRGSDMFVRCTIPPDAENRTAFLGVRGYTSSRRNLEGDQAPLVHELLVHHVPCDVGPAFCEVINSAGRSHVVEAPVVVTGCSS